LVSATHPSLQMFILADNSTQIISESQPKKKSSPSF
jgi:hypothetical protein